ncbi:MAG: substrate-binding domain-containing protein [Oscillospiraceae bacterium]|nr:substrate-binding domain-containing protein [Oscillospiraceae bacterium]
MKKIILTSLRTVGTVAVILAALFTLHRYEYLTSFADIDNVVGMIPVTLTISFTAGLSVLIWLRHSRRNASIAIVFGVLSVTCVVLFPTALRGDWWFGTVTPDGQESRPDLSLYAPFADDTLAVSLGGESVLKIADGFPRLDGATALYPVYSAFARAVYGGKDFTDDLVQCTNTINAYKRIVSGEADIIFVATASEQQKSSAKDAGADLVFTPIGREAFVFLVGDENPINGLTQRQVRNIYSGKTADWKTLGWSEGGKIIAFQRPEGSGSQTGLKYFMGDIPVQTPQPLPDSSLIGTNSLMNQVSVEWNGVQPALGYSYRYFAATMYANPNVKMLEIDGIAPTVDNIRNGTYPFAADFYAVTNGEPQGNVKSLIDWILSPQGKEIIEKTGYCSINN